MVRLAAAEIQVWGARRRGSRSRRLRSMDGPRIPPRTEDPRGIVGEHHHRGSLRRRRRLLVSGPAGANPPWSPAGRRYRVVPRQGLQKAMEAAAGAGGPQRGEPTSRSACERGAWPVRHDRWGPAVARLLCLQRRGGSSLRRRGCLRNAARPEERETRRIAGATHMLGASSLAPRLHGTYAGLLGHPRPALRAALAFRREDGPGAVATRH